jgi:hypothetical protein
VGSGGRFASVTDKTAFLNAYPAALRPIIQALVIDPGKLDRDAIESHEHVDTLLQALATLPLCEQAFVRLEVELTTAGGHHHCLDDTLEGRAAGRYVYRIRAVDAAGNVGSLTRSTLPVYIPLVMPPNAPVVTQVIGDDRRIALKWTPVGDKRVVRYRVFRADDPANSRDLRSMNLVGTVQTQPVPASVEFFFSDERLVALRPYFYRIVAECSDGMHSIPTPVAVGRAYEATPPDPPVVDAILRSTAGTETHLEWHCDYPQRCLLMRRQQGMALTQSRTSWLVGVHDAATDVWCFSVNDTELGIGKAYEYWIIGRTEAGNRTQSVTQVI